MRQTLDRMKALLHPGRAFLQLLAVIFAIEAGVMLWLPRILPANVSNWVESLLDASLLTALAAPIIWLLMIRPYRNVAQLRSLLLARVYATQEEERHRIARDLHDEIGQSLTTLLIAIKTMEQTTPNIQEHTESMREITARALDEVRRLARGLRPAVLDDLGLVAALERYVEDFTRTQQIAVIFKGPQQDGHRLPPVIETALYRIAQEGLTNVARHASAQRVEITLEQRSGEAWLTIADDGRGFGGLGSLRKLSSGGHQGLSGMQERAALLGGALGIDTELGRGTTIKVWIPLREAADVEDARTDR